MDLIICSICARLICIDNIFSISATGERIGWAFDGASGECVKCPQQPTQVPISRKRASIPALPVQEAQGIVWVWAGPLFEGAALAPSDSHPGPALIDAHVGESRNKSVQNLNPN